MSDTNIHCFTIFNQDAREGVYTMQGLALTRLLHNVIREYGRYNDDSLYVYLNDIDLPDKKLLLSHVASAEYYEEALSNPRMFDAWFEEYSPDIQKLLDSECDEVFRDFMEEGRRFNGYCD